MYAYFSSWAFRFSCCAGFGERCIFKLTVCKNKWIWILKEFEGTS